MFPKDELTKQIFLLIIGIFSLAGLWLLVRNPAHIPRYYPAICIVIFLSFIFGGVFSSLVFVLFFTIVSLLGVLISSSVNRIIFLISIVIAWLVLWIMNKYLQISETTASSFLEEIENEEIKLNNIKSQISATHSLCLSHMARIENYGQLSNFLNSICKILNAKEFFLSLKNVLEQFWPDTVELKFAGSSGLISDFGFEKISAPLFSNDRLSIIAPLGFENADYAVLKSRGEKFTDDDLRFFSLIIEFSKIALANIELYNRTQELSIIDGLTGVFLRGYFMERLSEEFELAKGHSLPLSVAMLDIDFFKKVNDTYGHPAGDDVLRTLSYILKHRLRETDIVGRYGGEEFILLLPHTRGVDAFGVMENIRKVVSKERFFIKYDGNQKNIHITVSIGVAELNQNTAGPEDLIAKADKNLYEAKAAGRNKVVAEAR